jgi:hypothetical protein
MSVDAIEIYVDAAALLAMLDLSEDSRTAVIANTRILLATQAQFMDLQLPDDLDPMAVLRL